jgi:hypothetical protein
MQFIRRRYQILAAMVLGPLGVLIATTVATAGENWSP